MWGHDATLTFVQYAQAFPIALLVRFSTSPGTKRYSLESCRHRDSLEQFLHVILPIGLIVLAFRKSSLTVGLLALAIYNVVF